jgi:uncharacterized protein (TIGR02453 family)
MITQDTISFLKDLQLNNNREWFHTNKSRYDTVKAGFEVFVEECLAEIVKFENWGPTTAKSCIFRINRDVRFSANKDPYKNFFSAAFGNGGRHSDKIDYYLHFMPDGAFLGGGMWAPTPEQLAKYRQEIDYNAQSLKDIIENKTFKNYFELTGDSLKGAPKGYDKTHPELYLLAKKQLFVMHNFTNEELISANFKEKIIEGCLIMKPFNHFFNQLFFDEA